MKPKKGMIAKCSNGKLGLITSDEPKPVTYSDGNTAYAYVGIHLTGDIGSEWSSRNPIIVGNIDNCIFLPNKDTVIDVYKQTEVDYQRAKELELTDLHRWEDGIDHHPMSERIVRFMAEHDIYDYDDHMCIKVGGDGDNGEHLMYLMDAFFEMLELDK